MIPARYEERVFSAVSSLMMGVIMSGVITFINTGLDGGFPARWLKAFAIGFPIAFISMQAISPLARRLAATLVSRKGP